MPDLSAQADIVFQRGNSFPSGKQFFVFAPHKATVTNDVLYRTLDLSGTQGGGSRQDRTGAFSELRASRLT